MKAADHVEPAFRFALAVQPERRIALSVLSEALDCLSPGKRHYPRPVGLPSLREIKKKVKRHINAGIHASTEYGRRLYLALHVVCERWERFQHDGKSVGDPIYAYIPSDVDYVLRYNRVQISHAITSKFAESLAVGQGCFTFQYARADISKVFPDWIDEANVRRQAKNVWEHLYDTFSGIITPVPRPRDTDPYDFVRSALRSRDEDRKLFAAFMSVAAPWSVEGYASDEAAYLAFTRGRPSQDGAEGSRWSEEEWRRLRALVERFPGIVRFYNSDLRSTLEDPEEMLRFPKIEGARREPEPHARFHQSPLTDDERKWLLQRTSERQRRRALEAPDLIVYVNGERKAVLRSPYDSADIRGSRGRGLLQVFAAEANQELLLAAVPLDEMDDAAVGRHYRVNIRVGRSLRLQLLMTATAGERDDEPEVVIRATLSPLITPEPKLVAALVVLALLAGAGYVGYRVQQQTTELNQARFTLRERATELAQRRWRDDMQQIVTARLQAVARTQTSVQLESLHAVLAARLQRGSFESLMTLGNAFLYGGDLAAAIRVFERAKAIRGSEVEPYNVLGAILHLQGRSHEAVAQLKQAVERWPMNSRVHVYLAWYLEETGDRDAAHAALLTALTLQKDYPDAQYNLGRLAHRAGRIDEAERHFDVAQGLLERDLRTRPEDGELHFQLAKLFATRGRNNDAAAHLQKAVAVDPDWAFWAGHETAFADLFGHRPDLRQILDELSMVPIAERIRAALTGRA